jgi:hypothetical protein
MIQQIRDCIPLNWRHPSEAKFHQRLNHSVINHTGRPFIEISPWSCIAHLDLIGFLSNLDAGDQGLSFGTLIEPLRFRRHNLV